MAEDLPPTSEGPEIVDPNNVPVVFVDWMITGGLHSGVLNLALGTIDHSLNRPRAKQARIVVASRLRCSRDFAVGLHKLLGDILNGPQDSNPETPPKMTLN